MHAPVPPKRSPVRTLALLAVAFALPAPAAALAGAGALVKTGGDAAPGSPRIAAVTCANQRPWTCARGQVLTIAGESLDGVRAVVFLGARGRRDDVRVTIGAHAAAHASAGELLTVVPRRARSGRIRVVGVIGHPALTPSPLHVLDRLPAVDDAGRLNTLVAGGRRRAQAAYTLAQAPAPGAAIEALRLPQGTVVKSWPLAGGAGDSGTVAWDGYAGQAPAATGTYVLRPNAAAAGSVRLGPGSDTQFELLEALFPIRGRHRIGRSAMQRFGGGRGHEGQDVFAACGTPLAALGKGVVQHAGFQGAAGNYVVVRRPDGESYAYMHLREPAVVEAGDRVFTGQRLGRVGRTGHADGCHLHIELWTAPGWYEGGRPYDPIAALTRWDAFS